MRLLKLSKRNEKYLPNLWKFIVCKQGILQIIQSRKMQELLKQIKRKKAFTIEASDGLLI